METNGPQPIEVSRFEIPPILIVSFPRSGTHFLQASLASHPRVRARGECFLRYRRYKLLQLSRQIHTTVAPFIFSNQPDRVNVGILMYNLLDFAEKECGLLLTDCKVIHLLRDARRVAYSNIQMRANRNYLGDKFKAHYRQGESVPPNSPVSLKAVALMETRVVEQQEAFASILRRHPNTLTIHYEDITCNRQVNAIPYKHAVALLAFLGLDYCPLTTTLVKTGTLVTRTMSDKMNNKCNCH